MECWLELDRWGKAGSLNNNCPGACRCIAPSIGCDVVDGVGCHLRCVDQNISRERSVDEGSIGQIVALVV